MSAKALKRIYHDPKDPGSLGGVDRLLWRAKQLHLPNVTRQTVEKYLKSEHANTLHKQARRRFTRNHTYVAGIDAQWQADLADMQGIARQNGGMRYLLTVIDVFSKFAWAIPVHSKDAKAITVAFGNVLTTANQRHPQRLQTDKRKEFFNSEFQALMKRRGISTLPVKASKRQPWWRGSTAPSRLGYVHICRIVAPCAVLISSRTWLMHTTTRATAP